MFGENQNSIFKDEKFTGGYEIPHGNLVCETEIPSENVSEPHIHPMVGKDWEVIASELERIKNGTRTIFIRKKNKNNGKLEWHPAKLGDCCVLIQTRTKWEELRQELIQRNIKYVMIAEKGLFGRPEISLIIDILDWLGNPHNKDSLARILRSPLVGLSDRALRYIAYHDFYLDKAIEDKNKPDWFDEEARNLVQGLIDLRDDLRWSREGKKSEMIEKILRYSHLDTIILAHGEGDQALANIWYLQDIISSWEEEELLQYSELIERLKFFRESGTNAYNMAVLADDEDKDSVKIATVHATKGLEFPVVFLFYTKLDFVSQWSNYNNSRLFIKDFGEFISLQQINPPSTNYRDWEIYFSPDNALKQPITRDGTFDTFNKEFYSEKWRLYYVALTRAKDHIYHSIEDLRKSFNWLYQFRKWYEKHKKPISVDDEIRPEVPMKIDSFGEKSVQFNKSKYEKLAKLSKEFIPKIINPSHIYDLIFCPRRYQYAVLQEVKGGPHCQYGIVTDYDSQGFGRRLHKALELRDFTKKKPNPNYINFIERIEEFDKNEAKRIEKAVESFLNSDIFWDYKLGSRRSKKELEVLHSIQIPTLPIDITMKDKIDLIVENDKTSVYIIDYKTNYPVGNTIVDEFIKKHHIYQLAAYSRAIEKEFGLDVKEAFNVVYNPETEVWEKKSIVEGIDIEEELLQVLPLEIIDGGLRKIPRKEFCPRCEFKETCKPKFNP